MAAAALRAWVLRARVRPRFFDQVGHETMYVPSGNKHFSTKSCHRQTYQSRQKLGTISENKVSIIKIYKNIFLKILIFKILYFLKLCPIFFSSVHNFGKSDNDKI